jgi:(2Fe-2S) ferredoxin
MVVVYPGDVWYAGVSEKGAKRIVDEHLVEGRPVEELRYVAPPGDNKL